MARALAGERESRSETGATPLMALVLATRRGLMQIRISPGILAALICCGLSANAQTYKSHIEHPIVRYKMSARLDPTSKKITGHFTLSWWNHTDDTIRDLYFHLYPNAFKNVDSTFMQESS